MRNIFQISLAFLLFFSINAFSQVNCDSLLKTIVESIRPYSPEDLLPYYDKTADKWGIMTKKGKVLTGSFADYAGNVTFNPDITYWGECYAEIKGKDYQYDYPEDRLVDGVAMAPTEIKDENYKGFKYYKTIHGTFEIKEYPAKYSLIYPVFSVNSKCYAVFKDKNTKKYEVFDENGTALPHFDFEYKELRVLNFDTDSIWFYFEDEKGNTGLKNLEGEIIFENQLLCSIQYSHYQYSIQNKDKQSGIFDVKNRKWLFKPQKKIKYQTEITVGLDYAKLVRYFVVEKGNQKYIVDTKGKAYKPKK